MISAGFQSLAKGVATSPISLAGQELSLAAQPNFQVDQALNPNLGDIMAREVPAVPQFETKGFDKFGETPKLALDTDKAGIMDSPWMAAAMQGVGSTMGDVSKMAMRPGYPKLPRKDRFNLDAPTQKFTLADLLASLSADPGRMRL